MLFPITRRLIDKRALCCSSRYTSHRSHHCRQSGENHLELEEFVGKPNAEIVCLESMQEESHGRYL